MHIFPKGNVTQTQPCTPGISNASDSTMEHMFAISAGFIELQCTLFQYRPRPCLPLPPPIVPVPHSPFVNRQGAQMRRCYIPSGAPNHTERAHSQLAIIPPCIGVPNITERVHQIGDSSALHRRCQSYGEGTRNSSALHSNHTERGTHNCP